jgi:hypothetical protein
MTLQTGKLYCITNSNNAIKLTNKDLVGEHVTLYMAKGGDVEISGGEVVLTAPPVDALDPLIGGMLIFVNPAYESVIKINGNTESSYLGTIYAPNADVEMSGTADVEDPDAMTYFYTQIIGLNVHITGNAIIDIHYNADENYPKPAYLDMLD